jgi:hypothetical protein
MSANFFKSFDLFPGYIKHSIEERLKHKTKVGGCYSFILIFLIIIFSIKTFNEYLFKNIPTISNYNTVENLTEPADLTHLRLGFKFIQNRAILENPENLFQINIMKEIK